VNAAAALIRRLDHASLARLARAAVAADPASGAAPPPDAERAALVARLSARHARDLAELLNAVDRDGLIAACRALQLSPEGHIGELRARLWRWGATLEAGGADHLGAPYQPVPVVLRSKLRRQGPLRGLMPPSEGWPRGVSPPVAAAPPGDEPDTVEALLERATALVGVRLGALGRDKGALGARLAALLGVPERGHAEADWRGEVELKSVPVVRDRSGFWRVKEDPAVAMEGAHPEAKLAQVLWLARVADEAGSPLLSWYFQVRDDEVARLIGRYLHFRPKGGRGATTRGHYLHKSFFLASGFLASLNG
jgi:hypothetical protein